METVDVKIIRLPAMRVASAYGYGASPESLAANKMNRFVVEHRLTDTQGGYQTYGFNNPNPAPGSPNYGYEVWIPIGPDIEATAEISIKNFSGGLYAVTHFTGLSRIGEVWQALVAWRESNARLCGSHQWLEFLYNPTEPDIEKYVFDLYLPLAEE